VQAESVAAFAGLLADRSRASVCLALLDGRAWTVGELARHACVGPSTMSEHLSVLVDSGLLAQERQGRHRYVRLAGPGVAELVEDLAAVAGVPVPIQSLAAPDPMPSWPQDGPATTTWRVNSGYSCSTAWSGGRCSTPVSVWS
jgi:DNA-binding transcriptional ArsR family regulator